MPVDPITLYVTHFSSLANGHALWNPDQGYADASGRLPHIRPGDVGFVDRSGSFIRLFNLHLRKDDVDQGIAVPKDFGDPLPKGPKGSHVWSYEAPTIQHVYKRSAWGGSLKADMPVSPANVNASMSFNFDHKTDAILGFFDTGVREKSIMNAKYFEEVVNNCENWLNAATETVDPNLSLRDLRLVTECTRVRSWVRGIVEDARKDGQLSLSVDFGPLSSGGQLSKSVEYKGGSHISHGPADRITKSQPVIDSGTSTQPLAKHSSKIKNKKSPNKDKFVKPPPSQPKSSAATLSEKDRENIKGWSDQCIFIRSLRFEHRLGIMGKNLPLKIRAQAKPNDLRKGGDPHEDAEDKYYVFSEDGDGESEDEKSWDHMVVVLEYIFENSDAEFALVHEEDLLPYARLVPLKKRVEPLTAALILEECHPKITTSDYNGIKVGTVSRPLTSPELGIHKGIASGISKINEDIPRYAVRDNSGSRGMGNTTYYTFGDVVPQAFPAHSEVIHCTSLPSAVNSVGFCSTGESAVSGCSDGTVRLWDTTSGLQLGESLHGHSSFVTCVSFSPDCTRIVSGSNDTTVQLWNVMAGAQIGGPFKGHTSAVTSIAFSPNGTLIVSGSKDNTLRVWDTATASFVYALVGHTDSVTSVAFSPDGRHVVSGSNDRTVRMWDVATGAEVERMTGHLNNVTSVAFSPTGEEIVPGSLDGTIRIWDAFLGQEIRVMKYETTGVLSVQWSPDMQYIASASEDGILCLWVATSGFCILHYSLPSVRTVAFCSDGRRIISGSFDGHIQIQPIPQHTDQISVSPLQHRDASFHTSEGKGKVKVRVADAISSSSILRTTTKRGGRSDTTSNRSCNIILKPLCIRF